MVSSSKAALVAVCLTLGTGVGTAAVLATTASAGTVSRAAATARTAASAGAQARSTGTGTVSITGPAGKTHTRSVSVSCRLSSRDRFVLVAGTRDAARGRTVRLAVKDDTGPGSYTASVLLIHRSRTGFRGRRIAKVPVTLTAAGGSFTVSETLTGKRHPALKGKTVRVSASWTCSA